MKKNQRIYIIYTTSSGLLRVNIIPKMTKKSALIFFKSMNKFGSIIDVVQGYGI